MAAQFDFCNRRNTRCCFLLHGHFNPRQSGCKLLIPIPQLTNSAMRFRKLRIAWSVFWGLACVLLTVLWLRSYWCFDAFSICLDGHRAHWVGSIAGELRYGNPMDGGRH